MLIILYMEYKFDWGEKIMRKPDKKVVSNLLLLVAFALFLALATVRYAPMITRKMQSPEDFVRLLHSYGNVGIFVFMFFQVLQVVIAVIPGEVVQAAGGYAYGMVFGTVYSAVGILAGSVTAFYLSRIFGYRLVKRLMPRGSFERFEFLLNSKRIETALFILFLIPGLPKDVLTYIAGFTPVNAPRFFLISILGRLPGIFVSALIGANMHEKQYAGVAIASAAALVLFIIGVAVKEKVIRRLRTE